jgi:glycosyltransferase involved in cell wall biosynthesis
LSSDAKVPELGASVSTKPVVCLLSREYPPDMGGVAGHTRVLASLFVRHGWQVFVLTERTGVGASNPEVIAIQPYAWPSVCRLVGKLKPDLLIIQYVPHMWGRGGVATTATRHIVHLARTHPTVIWLHELREPFRMPLKRLIRSTFHWAQLRWIERTQATLIVTNERYKSLLTARRQVDTLLVPAFSNFHQGEPLERQRPSIDGRGDGCVRFVLFGPARDSIAVVPNVVEALIDAIPSWHLSILGRYSSMEEDQMKRILGSSGVHGRVTFSPNAPEEYVVHVLESGKVFVSSVCSGPSGRHGTVSAGLQFGLPLIALDGPERDPWFVDGETCVLVQVNTAEAWSEAFNKVVDHSTVLRRLSVASTDLYDRLYSPEIVFANLVSRAPIKPVPARRGDI